MTFFTHQSLRFYKVIITITFFSGVFSANARVGDRKSSAASRYGRATKTSSILPGADTYSYSYKKWSIVQAYSRDLCLRARYISPYGNITQEELSAIFQAEDGHKHWNPLSEAFKKHLGIPSYQKAWSSSNGDIAKQSSSNTIEIDSKNLPVYLEKYARQQAAERKRKTPNF